MSPLARVILLGLATLLALLGILLAIGASSTSDEQVNPFQPDPQDRTVYLLVGAAALFASVVLFAVARREEAEVEGDSVGW